MARTFGAGASPGLDRRALERELIDEMTSWSTRERGPAFKNWHRHSISLVHLNVITELEGEGPMPMRRLAEALDVADASATGIVDRMEKRGLVERRHDTVDRRVVMVDLTDEGRAVFSRMVEHRREGLIRILAELADDEVAALFKGMRAIHAARGRMFELGGDPQAGPLGPPGRPPAAPGPSR
jgi:MarR family transcriptional regulator, organic hydroperoxide resistance regulator